ncbi:MAG: cphA [Gemmatimonadetes bacterium]|nr:cphA [Gemmatimonadota bacterium]
MNDSTSTSLTSSWAADHAGDLRIARTRAIRGPSVVHLAPVVVAEVRVGALAGRKLTDSPELIARLLATLPPVGGGAYGGLPESWSEALVRVALELQRMAGSPAAFGRVLAESPADDRWSIAVAFDEESLTEAALRDAARVMRDCLRGDDPEIESIVAELARVYERDRPGPTSLAMIEAAKRRGIPVRRNPDDSVIQLGLGAAQRRIRATMTDVTSAIATSIASDRRWTRSVLRNVGLPIPEDAETGTDGAPESAEGNEHRVVVVNRRVVACAERVPADVGATWIDRTDEMHPVNRTLCELAAGAIGLDVAGVELRTTDIAVPFAENGAVVSEIEASPEIWMHTHPDSGIARDVPGAILDMLYPPGAPTTIPVIAVTGTNGKTTTTRLIAHLFRDVGHTVGFTTTDGVYFQEHQLMEGDLTGPFAANIILSHPDVEVAVLETARGGILRAGLGFDACDVGVVLNVTADHLGLGGIDTVEQLADVKAVIAAVVKPSGHTVLNADDPFSFAMRERTPGRVVLFTTRPPAESPHVKEHLELGGIAARVERDEHDEEQLVIRVGEERHVLASLREVPLTFGGAARFQVGNILAASAVAYVQGMSAEQIRRGLLGFVPSAARTPGRLNVFETSLGRVIIDYAHNAAAIAGLLDFVVQLPAEHRMAILSVPGDRRDEDLREIGALAARMDYVIFKEHERYRRGREPGEAARMLAEGLLATGFPAERVAHFDDERDAVAHAIGVMRHGGVVAIMADDGLAVLEQLRPYAETNL